MRRLWGFTIVELLVVLAIVFLLLALALPAISQARESARRVACQSNLRQLMVALANYESTFHCYPRHQWVGHFDPPATALVNSFASIHALLLPYLEQGEVYALLGIDRGIGLDYGPAFARAPQLPRAPRVPLFLCPSSAPSDTGPGSNYRWALGVGPYDRRYAEFPDSATGPFPWDAGNVSSASVRDGLSHTAFASERVSAADGGGQLYNGQGFDSSGFSPADAAVAVCQAAPLDPGNGVYGQAGAHWMLTGLHQTLYNHALPPNSALVECLNFSYLPPVGIVTAKSNHPGGVNLALGDGAARFVDDTISIGVWRALATIADRDSTGDF